MLSIFLEMALITGIFIATKTFETTVNTPIFYKYSICKFKGIATTYVHLTSHNTLELELYFVQHLKFYVIQADCK